MDFIRRIVAEFSIQARVAEMKNKRDTACRQLPSMIEIMNNPKIGIEDVYDGSAFAGSREVCLQIRESDDHLRESMIRVETHRRLGANK